jgi:hypothetical protein
MAELLAVPLEKLAGMAENAGVLYGLMIGIGTIAAVSFAKSLGQALVSMIALIPKAALLLKIETGTAVAALTKLSATTLGVGAISAVIGAGLAVAAFKAMQKVEDGFADSSRGPFTITDRFGATAITTPGDNLAVSPNVGLRGTNRNEASTMQLDYNQLAEAIAKGAERGTSKARLALNIDGRKFADSQQVPSILGQYRFSS